MADNASLLGRVDEDAMFLDPPDPVDLLLASTHDSGEGKSRPLDFVRARLQEYKKENRRLRERVTDLEQTLSIVQTAQEWTINKQMTPEQAEKMKEIKALLEHAKRAREEIQNFSGASRQALYEKLRTCKLALKKEREEKREMKDRLLHAFDHARIIKEQHQQLLIQKETEDEKWQTMIRGMKERHRRTLRKLQGDGAVEHADRQEQLSHFGEQVIEELATLQNHLQEVRKETVDGIIPEGDDLENGMLSASGGKLHDTSVAGSPDLYGSNSFEDDDFEP